jgi:glycerol uptake facilitator-like aquaporin
VRVGPPDLARAPRSSSLRHRCQNLSDDLGLRLLDNAAATAAGLYALILVFGPVSGGHFNPVVTAVDAAFGGLSWREAAA